MLPLTTLAVSFKGLITHFVICHVNNYSRLELWDHLAACCHINYKHRWHKRLSYNLHIKCLWQLYCAPCFILFYSTQLSMLISYICLIVVEFHMDSKLAVPWSLPSQKKAIPTKQGLRRTRKQRIELSVKKAWLYKNCMHKCLNENFISMLT